MESHVTCHMPPVGSANSFHRSWDSLFVKADSKLLSTFRTLVKYVNVFHVAQISIRVARVRNHNWNKYWLGKDCESLQPRVGHSGSLKTMCSHGCTSIHFPWTCSGYSSGCWRHCFDIGIWPFKVLHGLTASTRTNPDQPPAGSFNPLQLSTYFPMKVPEFPSCSIGTWCLILTRKNTH